MEEIERRTDAPEGAHSLIRFNGPLSRRERQRIEKTVHLVEASGRMRPAAKLFGPRWWIVDERPQGKRLLGAYRLGAHAAITAPSIEALTRKMLELKDRRQAPFFGRCSEARMISHRA